MPVADLDLPTRLLAGGGPSAPDPRVLQAMALPTIGQFDPDFTAIMDEVMQLGRSVLLTSNRRCFPVGGPGAAGLEAVLNSLLEPGDRVAILDVPAALGCAQALGVEVVDDLDAGPRLVVAAATGDVPNVPGLAATAHARGALLVLEATSVLGGRELRVDDWAVDVCVAGVDHCLGGPSGLALVTYSEAVEAALRARRTPPPVSFLDLLQLQAYWSPERLNHHTAPTNLVYGLREALRLVLAEGLSARWARHQQVFAALTDGLGALGLVVCAAPPIAVVSLPDAHPDEATARQRLRADFGIHVQPVNARSWRLGLLGADATLGNATRVLSALEQVLAAPGTWSTPRPSPALRAASPRRGEAEPHPRATDPDAAGRNAAVLPRRVRAQHPDAAGSDAPVRSQARRCTQPRPVQPEASSTTQPRPLGGEAGERSEPGEGGTCGRSEPGEGGRGDNEPGEGRGVDHAPGAGSGGPDV